MSGHDDPQCDWTELCNAATGGGGKKKKKKEKKVHKVL